MARFKNDEDVLRWLASKPREVGNIFAARTASRAIPLLADRALDVRLSRLRAVARPQVLRAFRGVAVSWAKAAYPADRAIRGAAAAPITDSKLGLPSQLAAEYAAAATVNGETDGAAREFATLAVTHAIHACISADARSIKAFLEASAADADTLDRGISPVAVANSQLWPGPSNTWPLVEWTQLRPALLAADEDWDVWTDWYEDRLMGRAANQALEAMRATIPNEVWQQGPRVVNAEIKRLIEDPKIFDEVMREDGLERRLTVLSLPEVAVIGARAALRALPLMSFGSPAEPTFSAAFLKALRITSLTWAAAAYPARTPNRVTLNFARVDAINSGVGLVRAIAAAGAGYSTNQVEEILQEVVLGIRALRTASAQSDGDASAAAFDLALSQDLNDLRGAPKGSASLAKLELWPGGAPPEWSARRWEALRRELIGAGLGWEVWADWYEDRLWGRIRSEAHEHAYVEVPDGLWKEVDDPARVNTWIQRRFDRLADQALAGGDTSSGAPPAIPAQQPAAIQPIWSKGRLTLPKAAAKSDLKGRSFVAALKSLRQELRALTDAVAVANVDPRFVLYSKVLADQVPEKAPRQAELFQLGHAGGVFAGYAKTVNEEWPPFLAARFHAVTMQFDDTMRQSPLWREFKRNAARQSLSPPQVEIAAAIVVSAAGVLRGEDATEFVDPAIPAALEALSAPLRSTSGLPKDFIEAGNEELAYDLVESLNNILKLMAAAALWGWQAGKSGATWISDTAKQGKTVFLSEARKSVVNEFERAGKAVGPGVRKLLSHTLKLGAAYAGGKPLLVWLVANYPSIFGWLEPVAKFLSHHAT